MAAGGMQELKYVKCKDVVLRLPRQGDACHSALGRYRYHLVLGLVNGKLDVTFFTLNLVKSNKTFQLKRYPNLDQCGQAG